MRGPAIAAAALVLGSCGGGGSSAPAATTTATAPATTTPAVPVNRAPVVANANADQRGAVGAAFSYNANQAGAVFTDPDGDPMTYTLTLAPAGGGLTVTGMTIAGNPTTVGVVVATLTASDGKGGVTAAPFNIVVGPSAGSATLGVPTLPAALFAYADARIGLPAHFTQPGIVAADNTPAANPTTDAGATLGRVLFYDRRLSLNDTISCASCHRQALGFADSARFSVGFQGGTTPRHSMGLANARYYGRGRFFWDERAATLEDQVITPIQDPVEMGMNLATLTAKLAATDFYPPLFRAAFGTTEVTAQRVSQALAQFVRSMVSYRSRFDQAFTANPPQFAAVLTQQEERGRQIFMGPGRCDRCHTTNAQVSDNVHNNGLDATVTDAGAGNGRFKSPSLRNVALRGPFMHDGRFATLAQVVDHYDSGVQASPGLDQALRDGAGAPLRLNLSAAEKQALIAFMSTLTDAPMIADPKFSNPFPN